MAIKVSDLFDLKDINQLKKAEKFIKDIDKAYSKMAKDIETNSKNIKVSLETIAKSTSTLKKSVDNLRASQEAEQKQIAETNAQLKSLSSTQNTLISNFKKLQSSQEKVNAERREVNRLAKENQNLQAKVAQATSKEALDNEKLKQKLNQLNAERRKTAKEALGQISLYQKESAKVRDLANQYLNLSLKYGKNSKEARAVKKEHDKLRQSLLSLEQSVGRNQRQIGGYSKAFNGLKSVLAGAGIILGLQTVIRLLGNMINIFKNLSKENSTLAAILNKTKQETQALQQQQLELGRSTEFTATQVAKAQIELARLGKTEQQILDMTPGILAAATALQTDLASAASLVAGQLNAFQLEASESGRVADVLARSTQISAFNFSKLENALGIVSPAGKAVNATLEDTLGILTAAIDTNIDASTAATGLRNIFIELSSRGISLNEALNMISNSTDQLKTANELFGKRSAIVATVIANNTDKIRENIVELNNARGTAKKFADQELDNLEGDIKLLTSAWEGFVLGIENGDGIINKFLRGSLQALTKLLGSLTDELEAGLSPLELQRIEFTSLTNALISLNPRQEERRRIINRLNKEYGEYLPFLLSEKTTKEELIKVQQSVNDKILQTILLKQKEKDLENIAKVQIDLAEQILDRQKEIGRLQEVNRKKNIEADKALKSGNIGRSQQIDQEIRANENLIDTYNDEIDRLRILKDAGITAASSITLEYEKLKNQLGIVEKTTVGGIDNINNKNDEQKEIINGLIESLEAQLKVKRELVEKSTSKEEISILNQEIQLLGNKLKKLRELGLEQPDPNQFDDEVDAIMEQTKVTDESAEAMENASKQADGWRGSLGRLASQLLGFGKTAAEMVIAAANAIVSVWSTINQFFDNAAERRIQARELEIERLEEQKERELSIAGDNADARARIEERFAKKQQRLEEQNRRDKTRAAKREKAVRVAQSIIDTAAAVVEAGVITPLAIATGIAGALQTAVIASTPIPAFEKGTDNAPGGLALVGEKGRELVREPSGKTYLTGDKAELRDIPKGSQILTNAITERMLRDTMSGHERGGQDVKDRVEYDRKMLPQAIWKAAMTSNSILSEEFAKTVSKLPIHQIYLKRGDFQKNVKVGQTTHKEVINENRYG